MSERKVLNKYYPIDYDPRRLPRQKGMGNIEDKIMVIRTMAPFHMRCKTCGEYSNIDLLMRSLHNRTMKHNIEKYFR